MNQKYLNFVEKNYSQLTGFDYFFSDIKKSIEFCKNNNIEIFDFEIINNKDLLACISLFYDKNNETAIFGFFECIDDEIIFKEIWEKLFIKAKQLGIKKLIGPINANTWFQYRCISFTDNENFFPSEPLSKKYYSLFFSKISGIKVIDYHSAYRKNFDTIIKITESSYNLAINQNFRIETVETPNFEQIKQIYQLSKIIFSQNWGYQEISFENFLNLYNKEKIDKYVASIYLLLSENTIIGFASNLMFSNTLIMKTIGILPEYQSQGLGNALVHKIHLDAVNKGVEKIIYALVKKTNKVKYFPTDDIQVFREYSAFELEI